MATDQPIPDITPQPFPGFVLNDPSTSHIKPFKGFVVNPSAPDNDASDLTQNPHKEGLYRMKAEDGKTYGIPYSRVSEAQDKGYDFSDDQESTRHDKDFKAAQPSLWEKVRGKVTEITEPTTEAHNKPAGTERAAAVSEEASLNTLKRAGRVLFGAVDLTPQVWGIIKKIASDDPKVSEEGEKEIQDLHPGAQIVNRVREFKQDWKKDPNLAVANSVGDALGIYLTDKAAEVVKATPAKVVDIAKDTLRNRAGAGARGTRQIVAETAVKNEHTALEAEEIRKANDKIIADAKTKSEKAHADKVSEVREANKKAAENHAKKVEKIVSDNSEVHESAKAAHEKELAKVREKNEAAEKAAAERHAASEEEHDKKVKEVEEENIKAKQQHEEAVAKKEKLETRRAELRRQTLELRNRVFDRVKALKAAGRSYFDKQYDVLEKATEKFKAPLNKLVDAVYDAKADKIEGSDTKQAIFDDILKRAKGESGGGGNVTHKDIEGYDDLAPDERAIIDRGGAGGVDDGISYKDLRGYDRELGKVIGSPSTASDVRQAAIEVQKTVRQMQQDLANQAGTKVGDINRKVSSQYRNYAETFYDNAGPSGSGSAVAQAVKAEDAFNGTKPFLDLEPEEISRAKKMLRGVHQNSDWVEGYAPGDAGSKGRSWRQYRWDTAKLVEQLVRLNDEDKSLPNTKELPPPPEPLPPPEFKLLPATRVTQIAPEPVFEPPTLRSKTLKAIPEPPVPQPEPEYIPPAEKPASYREPPNPSKLTPEQLKLYKRERLNAAIKKMEHPSALSRSGLYTGVGGLAGAVAHYLFGEGIGASIAIGGGVSILADMSRKGIADILSKPSVQESLTRITQEDLDELSKLPANQQAQVENTLAVLGQEAKRIGAIKTTSPWVKYASRGAAVTAANTIDKGEKKEYKFTATHTDDGHRIGSNDNDTWFDLETGEKTHGPDEEEQ